MLEYYILRTSLQNKQRKMHDLIHVTGINIFYLHVFFTW